MKAIVKLNHITLEIDEREEMETLHKAIVLSHPRGKCTLCDNTERFYWTSNKDKEGNVYVNYKCAKCGARSKLGQYKAGGYFWRDFEKWDGRKPARQDPEGELEEGDDIPLPNEADGNS